MKKYTAICRLLISFSCIVFLLTSCDDSAKSLQKPTVVRKKIAAKGQPKGKVTAQKPSPARPVKKVPRPVAPEAKPVKAEKPPVAKPLPPASAPVKPAPAPPASKPPQKPMVAQAKPALQKPAEAGEVPRPKSDISALTPRPKASPPPPQGPAKSREDQPVGSNMMLASTTGESSLYNPAGKIDPFEPLFKDKPSPKKIKKSKRKPRGQLTPLEKIDISQLTLVGIIMAGSGNRALVEESSGKGYVIRKGTKIGRNLGVVTAINKNAVIVEEEYEDVFGKLKVQKKKLKLPKPPGEL